MRIATSVALSTLYAETTFTTGLAFAIPTPGTAGLLALAGLGAARRRR